MLIPIFPGICGEAIAPMYLDRFDVDYATKTARTRQWSIMVPDIGNNGVETWLNAPSEKK